MEARLDNIEHYLDFGKLDSYALNLRWVDPIFICAMKAYSADTGVQLPTFTNSYIQRMLTASYNSAKTFTPVERIYSRLEVDKIAEHITSTIMKSVSTKTFVDRKDISLLLRYIFSELMNNVADHANSPVGGFAMAQYYPNKGEVQFAISDRGIGFLQNIKLVEPSCLDECRAIEIAMQCGITASQAQIYGMHKNAGYGLYAFERIIEQFGGELVIISNDGLVRKTAYNKECKGLNHHQHKGVTIGCKLKLENVTLSYEDIMDIITSSEEDDIY